MLLTELANKKRAQYAYLSVPMLIKNELYHDIYLTDYVFTVYKTEIADIICSMGAAGILL
jgi:hypothetical protein